MMRESIEIDSMREPLILCVRMRVCKWMSDKATHIAFLCWCWWWLRLCFASAFQHHDQNSKQTSKKMCNYVHNWWIKGDEKWIYVIFHRWPNNTFTLSCQKPEHNTLGPIVLSSLHFCLPFSKRKSKCIHVSNTNDIFFSLDALIGCQMFYTCFLNNHPFIDLEVAYRQVVSIENGFTSSLSLYDENVLINSIFVSLSLSRLKERFIGSCKS